MNPPGACIRPLGADRILIEAGHHRILADAQCPHRGGRLRFGWISTRTLRLTCPLHHASFDLLTGHRVNGPDCPALRLTVLDSPPAASQAPTPPVTGGEDATT